MGFLSSLRAKPRLSRNGSAFPAADIGRLTSSWQLTPGAINRWLRYELRKMRMRSRDLARGDAYGGKFIRACVDNIAGPNPFVLQAKAKTSRGEFNDAANDNIESAWADRSRVGAYEVTGKLSRAAADRLIIRCLARDGEALMRKVRGPDFGGAAGQWQILDIDRLDELLNRDLKGGGSIKMGVELSPYSKPVAYHVLKQHPGELGDWAVNTREYERIPADQICHLFIADWPEQVRGLPWMHAAMVRLYHLGGFEEAAVINARIGASKIAVLQGPDSASALAQQATGKDTEGNLLSDIEPGQYWRLPDGVTLNSFNPQFPDASVGPFISACLRGAASAVGMAYHSLANDPQSVNYSTARVALLEERDMWRSMQNWYVEHFCETDAVDWMRGAILDGTLPQTYWPYRNALRFQPKTWQWVDPLKEVGAKIEALNAKLTSRTRIAAEDGVDLEDVFDEIAAEEALAKAKGVELVPIQPKVSGAIPDAQAQGDTSGDTAGTSAGKSRRRWRDPDDAEAEREPGDEPITVTNNITVPERSVEHHYHAAPTPPAQVTNEIHVEPAQVTNEIRTPEAQVVVNNMPAPAREKIIEHDAQGEIVRIVERDIKDTP